MKNLVVDMVKMKAHKALVPPIYTFWPIAKETISCKEKYPNMKI